VAVFSGLSTIGTTLYSYHFQHRFGAPLTPLRTKLKRRRKRAQTVGMTAVQWLLSRPSTGKRGKRQLDKSLRAERDSWA
jgi:hypothetical protein